MAELAAVPPLQVVAQRPLLAQPLQVLVLQALALLALVLLAKDVVVREQLLLLAQPQLLAQAPREAAVAQEAVQLLTRSFSAAMAGALPPPGPPMYAPAPRSRRKPKRRPCPLT